MGALDNEETWEKAKKRLKEKYPDLNEEDLYYADGYEQKLVQRLQKRLDLSRDEVQQLLTEASNKEGH